MRKFYSVLIFLGCLIDFTSAQVVEERDSLSQIVAPDTLLEKTLGVIPESLDSDIDSLLHSWHVRYFTKTNDFCHDDTENVYFPDSVYAARLAALPCLIPMPYNNAVRKSIDLYTEKRRKLVRYMLGMANYYFPMIEEVLDRNGLPIELKYLAIVESALNPVALSRAGASGLWQFMLPTAKSYGLKVNSLIDERCDPVKATEAACAYLKDMYAIYNDWNLVLASYNCGPGNVNKAIKRSGGKTNFWDLFPYLPSETRSYVPLFIAANYVMNYYCDHNICPIDTDLPLATDTIHPSQMLHFRQISEMLDIDIAQLRALNPQYKRDIIPGKVDSSILKLPAEKTYAFVDVEDSIYNYRAEELLPTFLAVKQGGADFRNSARERITHIVERNESIYKVANRYGVTPREIKIWNRLPSYRLTAGKRLTVYVDNGGIRMASNKKAKSNSASGEKDGYIAHIVSSGESLSVIASKYPGVTARLLMQINNLISTRIMPGQVLKVPVG